MSVTRRVTGKTRLKAVLAAISLLAGAVMLIRVGACDDGRSGHQGHHQHDNDNGAATQSASVSAVSTVSTVSTATTADESGTQNHRSERRVRHNKPAPHRGSGGTAPTVALSTDQVTSLKTDMVVATAQAVTTQTSGGGNSHSLAAFREGEVLAIGMDQVALANARALGFQVDYQTGDDDAFYSVTRLKAPAGIDTQVALRSLMIALPSQVVALNSIYRIYGNAGDAEDTTPSPSATASCAGDRCKPWTVIGWKDYLRGCSNGLAIGMIDTGLDTKHPALASGADAAHIVTADFKVPDKRPALKNHGTAVASLLMGDARHGVAGLVPDATLYAADAFYADGDQSVTDTVSVLRALDWLKRQGVRIVNMSFTGPSDPLLAIAIDDATRDGMVIIAAAGNNGPDAPKAYPAAYPNVIAVTAVSSDLKPYQRANHGDYIAFSAPGVHIWTAGANGKGTFESGTSFAAPYVTALAATVIRAAGPHSSYEDVLNSIPHLNIGAPGSKLVFGRLGLARAPETCGGGSAESLPWGHS